jgi:hypothetical protein
VSALAVIVDGVALEEDAARALWERFSAHMEANKGDLAGFAKAEGFSSVHPEMHSGRAVLVVSRTAAQRAFGKAPVLDRARSDGGARIQPKPKKPI